MNMKIGVLAIVVGFTGAVLFSQNQRPTEMPDLGGAVGWLNSGALSGKLCEIPTFAGSHQAPVGKSAQDRVLTEMTLLRFLQSGLNLKSVRIILA
jgi:hypothetical protein